MDQDIFLISSVIDNLAWHYSAWSDYNLRLKGSFKKIFGIEVAFIGLLKTVWYERGINYRFSLKDFAFQLHDKAPAFVYCLCVILSD